ncbi:MAG: glycosyltransferase family 39 protein [Bacteroidia bacterium]|nr:glycosyltransferase family 39 protein [Bacteroidia bacterium]
MCALPAAHTRWMPPAVLAAASLVYLIIQAPACSLPYFWDELGVYAPAILYLVDHKISLLPAAMPVELSRGHPLLYHALMAAGARLVGAGPVSLHGLALGITLSGAWILFLTLRRQAGVWGAAAAALCWLCLPNVFIAANLLLPEIPLALCCYVALWAWGESRMVSYLIACAAALLIKETALVVPLAALGWSLWQRDSLPKLALALTPLLVFGGFLLVQKLQLGWWLNPYHTSAISLKPATLQRKFGRLTDYLMVYQGRMALVGAMLVTGIVAYIRGPRRMLAPWLKLGGIFTVLIAGFTVLNFYMDRYLLILMPVYCVWAGLSVQYWIAQRPAGRWVAVLGGMVIVIAGWYPQQQPVFRYDQALSYRSYVEVQQDAARFLDSLVPAGEAFFVNFPLYNSFEDPRYGYARHRPEATVRWSDTLRYAAVIEPPPTAPDSIPDSAVIRVFSQGNTRVQIYKLRP